MTNKDPISVEKLLKDFGGAAGLARKLKGKRGRKTLTRAAVSMWKRVPLERVHEIVALSAGKYTPEQLRPDFFKKAA